MPKWIHDRAAHLRAKNPDMPKSMSYAIATQQAHALGKSPKGYGTAEGRAEAKEKYDTPQDDKKTADPGGVGAKFENRYEKKAWIGIASPFDAALVEGFSDELQKIGGMVDRVDSAVRRWYIRRKTKMATGSATPPNPTGLTEIKAKVPKNSLSAAKAYTKVNAMPIPSPATGTRDLSAPPAVRT